MQKLRDLKKTGITLCACFNNNVTQVFPVDDRISATDIL